MRKILISSLEPSANLHLEQVLKHAKDTEIIGIFDEKFGAPLYPSSDFSVMGFLDVLGKVSKAKKAIKEMAKMSFDAEHILLIDSPAFNIPLMEEIRKVNKNVPITWYILPKVWAWRKKRAKKLLRHCTTLASIFPFENMFFERSTYVGNPLLDEITLQKNELESNGNIAFLPGSRKSEIKALMGVFREVSQKINKKSIIVIPKHFSQNEIEKTYGDLNGFEISNDTHKSLYEAEFAFICSGTATLEAALIGTPFALCYKAKKLDFFIARMFVKLKYVGLSNIIFSFCGKEALHKEFLQNDVNAENLLEEYETMDRCAYFKHSRELKEILGHGSSAEVANIIGYN